MNISIQNSKRYIILAGFAVYSLVLLFVIGTVFPSQAKQISIASQTSLDEYTVNDRMAPVTGTGSFTYYFPLVVNNYAVPIWTFVGLSGLPIRQVVSSTNGTLYAVIESALILTPTNSIYRSIDDGVSWQSASSGLSGRVRSLFVHPLSPTLLLAGTLTGGSGIHRSDDGGQHWSDVGLAPAIRVVAAHPTTPTLWLVGSYNPLIFGSAYIHRTENAGASWDSVIPTTTVVVDSFAFDLDDPNRAYACTAGGFLSSTDAGLIWSYEGSDSCGELTIDPYTHTVLYAVNGSGVLKSEDKGLSWTQILTGEHGYWTLAVNQVKPGTLYAGNLGNLFTSVDGGSSWQQSSLPADSGPVYIADLAVGRSNELFVATDQGIWKVSFK